MLRGLDTPHVIKATAFYKQEGNLFFVFPWAQHGNLRKFWREKIPAIRDRGYLKWVFEQLLGLADAIKTLHHHADDDRMCRHGDLKPENILCFNLSTSSKAAKDYNSCILVISDVGLSRTHDKSTQLRSKTKLVGGETIAYAPPETELNPDQATSRRYDIWSLGCLYLEFIIWFLYGIGGLDEFLRDIEGKFYTITHHPGSLQVSSTAVKIKPQVNKWIERIEQDPKCATIGAKETAVFRLVNLVKKRCLVTIPNSNPEDPVSAPSNSREKKEAAVSASEQPSNQSPVQVMIQAPTAISSDNFHNKRIPQATNLPEAGKNERAFAPEVCRELVKIIQDVEDGITEWINLDENVPELSTYLGVEYATGSSTRSINGSTSRNNEVSTTLYPDRLCF